MITPDNVFNIPIDLSYDKCYPLDTKTTIFCFAFVLIIANPKIFN